MIVSSTALSFIIGGKVSHGLAKIFLNLLYFVILCNCKVYFLLLFRLLGIRARLTWWTT